MPRREALAELTEKRLKQGSAPTSPNKETSKENVGTTVEGNGSEAEAEKPFNPASYTFMGMHFEGCPCCVGASTLNWSNNNASSGSSGAPGVSGTVEAEHSGEKEDVSMKDASSGSENQPPPNAFGVSKCPVATPSRPAESTGPDDKSGPLTGKDISTGAQKISETETEQKNDAPNNSGAAPAGDENVVSSDSEAEDSNDMAMLGVLDDDPGTRFVLQFRRTATRAAKAARRYARSNTGAASNSNAPHSLSILLKLITNLIQHPGDEKFREIKITNPRIANFLTVTTSKKRVPAGEELGAELLQLIGFKKNADNSKFTISAGHIDQGKFLMAKEILENIVTGA